MSEPVDLSVIVISHGHEAMLPACLQSLAAGTVALATEIVLIDNLQNGGVSRIADLLPASTILIENSARLGFAANVNKGEAVAHGRHILVLNPDTEMRSGQLAAAIAFLDEHPEIGILGCRLLNRDGSVQQNYRAFPTIPFLAARAFGADRWPRRPAFYRKRLMEGVQSDAPHPVDWVFGAFMLMRRSDFRRIGGMDAGYELYYEDVDLCFRFRICGLSTYIYPGIQVLHEHLRTSAAKPLGQHWRWHVRSAGRYFRKSGHFSLRGRSALQKR